jgi:RNA polymerase sigma-70 factor (ECF subfamily)
MAAPIILGRIAAASPAEVPISAEASPAMEFASLVRQQQGMVYSLALHFLHDPAAAEEVAQDVFLELHNSLGKLSSAEHITFWLRKVTSHRCIDRARRKRWQQLSLEEVPEPSVEGSRPDPLLKRSLRRLVASLPETARMVVILRYQEDLTPTEIAEVLSMPVATVKSQLQRSLAMLREKMTRLMEVR